MRDKNINYGFFSPNKSLSDYVESFWFLHNQSNLEKETIGLPDGRIDLIFFKSPGNPFQIILLGLGTEHKPATIPAHTKMFVISFKLLAVDYILKEPISNLVDSGKVLPSDFWGFSEDDLQYFDCFMEKATLKMESLIPHHVDNRKKLLFAFIYESKGSITVQMLAEKVIWSSRQINRYFNQQFGLSLKAYCNVLRFRASLEHVAQGKLFPEENFFDQAHFIKEIKKFSGVVPKELLKNKNDRFILLSSLNSE